MFIVTWPVLTILGSGTYSLMPNHTVECRYASFLASVEAKYHWWWSHNVATKSNHHIAFVVSKDLVLVDSSSSNIGTTSRSWSRPSKTWPTSVEALKNPPVSKINSEKVVRMASVSSTWQKWVLLVLSAKIHLDCRG